MATEHPEFKNLDAVSLNKLHLDALNPRHDPLNDEDEIIAQLYKSEQVLSLAKDIVAKGALSPLDRTGVVELDGNPGHYVVVEGNRRTCALKLLHDPQKAPDQDSRQAFQKLAQNFDVPFTLPVVVFADRSTARPWIGLRHLGVQDGAGTLPWTSPQKARYAHEESPNQLALAVLDRAQDSGWIDAEQRRHLAITTLTRYLSNPLVRGALGLGSNRELQYTHEVAEVDAALRQFLMDAIRPEGGGTPLVNSRSKKPDREAYARELATRGVSPRTVLSSPIQPPDATKTTPKAKPRSLKNPDSRKYLIPSGFVITLKDKNLHRLRQELERTPIDEHELAVNYLLRALLERVMTLYAQHRTNNTPANDQKLVNTCVQELEKSGASDNMLKAVRIAQSDKDSAHSLHTLGAAVHASVLPSRKSLTAAWENWETALKLMLAQLQ